MKINNLPIEIFMEILLKTDGTTLGACRRVCKKWKKIIDSSEYLWEKSCYKDFPYASKIAKEKCHSACGWHNIYKNLTMWNNANFTKKWEIQYDELEFPLVKFIQNLKIELKPTKYKKLRFANNEYALVLFYNLALGVVRPVDTEEYKTERYFQAMGFSLYAEKVYFYNERDVFICDLLSPQLDATCIHHSDYDIVEIQHFDGKTFLFTSCGNIVTLSQGDVSVKAIRCPPQWRDQIRHICAIDDRNYIYYSRYLFNIETERNRHLYLDFKAVTALFFYEDNVLIADIKGYIWLYRLRDQKFASKPIMEPITILPQGQFATQLDIIERNSGTVIIATTFDKIILLAIDFFPEVSINDGHILDKQ